MLFDWPAGTAPGDGRRVAGPDAGMELEALATSLVALAWRAQELRRQVERTRLRAEELSQLAAATGDAALREEAATAWVELHRLLENTRSIAG